MAAARLSRLQQRILAWLLAEARRTRGTMAASHQDLVRAMAVDKGNLSRSLLRLEDREVIRIVRTPGGKTEAVTLTRRGQQVVRKPEVVLPKPRKRYRTLSDARWHERRQALRVHINDVEHHAGLFERLAETWTPEVQAGYHRELLQLIDQLTRLARRLEGVMQEEASDDP